MGETIKEKIKMANEVWEKLIAKATVTNKEFLLHATINEVSLISFVLGCALGMESGLKTRRETDVDSQG